VYTEVHMSRDESLLGAAGLNNSQKCAVAPNVEGAIKMVVSAGRTIPERAGEKLSAGASGGNAVSKVNK
jgi:hypothetical protein